MTIPQVLVFGLIALVIGGAGLITLVSRDRPKKQKKQEDYDVNHFV